MTKTRDNSLTMNYSGKYGNQFVYRTREDMSILAKKPKKSKNPPTVSQSETRVRFQEATIWAKKALQDPDILAVYAARAKGMKTPYILAVTNHMHPPVVKEIITEEYTGEIGSAIGVKVLNNFYINGVMVKITDASGTLVEQGPCTLDPFGVIWGYTATKEITNLTGVVITAVAKDYPKHTGSLSVTL